MWKRRRFVEAREVARVAKRLVGEGRVVVAARGLPVGRLREAVWLVQSRSVRGDGFVWGGSARVGAVHLRVSWCIEQGGEGLRLVILDGVETMIDVKRDGLQVRGIHVRFKRGANRG